MLPTIGRRSRTRPPRHSDPSSTTTARADRRRRVVPGAVLPVERATADAIERRARRRRDRPMPPFSGIGAGTIPRDVRAALPRWTSRTAFLRTVHALATTETLRVLCADVGSGISPATWVAAMTVLTELSDASGELRASEAQIADRLGRKRAFSITLMIFALLITPLFVIFALGDMGTVMATIEAQNPANFDAPADRFWTFVGTLDNNATWSEMRFLAKVAAHAPGPEGDAWRAAVIKGVLERAGVEAGEVDEVVLGQVLGGRMGGGMGGAGTGRPYGGPNSAGASGGSASSAIGGAWKRLGPAHCTGDARSAKTGSVSQNPPRNFSSSVEWPRR